MSVYDTMPILGAGAFVAPNASVIGDVQLGAGSSVWYGAVLRGASGLLAAPPPPSTPACRRPLQSSVAAMGSSRWARPHTPGAGSCCGAGDVNSISVGDATALHDRVLVSVGATGPASEKRPAVIGSRVSVGQGAILHACTIHDEASVGAGAHVLDGATIEKHGALEAGAVLAPGATIKSGEVRRPLSAPAPAPAPAPPARRTLGSDARPCCCGGV
jgi:carbonic anhydrase/acetyltransferase-like protein (isoleucine patch superfamily)